MDCRCCRWASGRYRGRYTVTLVAVLTNQSLIAQGYTGGQTAYAQPVPAYADTGHEAYKHPHEVHEMQATHSSQHPQELPGSEHARFR
jgi:hypothetical protein